MRKKILMTSLVLLSLSGCQNTKENQAEHDAKIAAQAKAELRAELEEARRQKEAELQKNNKLGHMGISTDEGKLIIDTHKTKDFLQQMAEKMKDHADKLSKDFEKGVIDDKEAGIEMNQTHINIDLDKTKSFLENWEKTLESYAKEFNKMTQEYSKELKKDTNAAN